MTGWPLLESSLAWRSPIGIHVTVQGAAGDPTQVGILEQFADQSLEQFAVRHRVDSLDDVPRGSNLRPPDKQSAQLCDETRAGLDERVSSHLRGQSRPRIFQPAAILGQKILELSAFVARAREEVVPGAGVEFHGG